MEEMSVSMHLIIGILFIITVCLSFIEDKLKSSHKLWILMGYAFVMVVLAATKDINHTADASAYEMMFHNNDSPMYEKMTEPSFIFLSRVLLSLGGTITTLFLVYALITIPAKLKAISSITPFIFTALVIYIPIYFEVQDLIQIRAAAATMFFLSSIKPLADKRYLLATVLVICAIVFHYSSICYIPFLFLGNRRLNVAGRIVVASLMPLCFILYSIHFNAYSFFPDALNDFMTYKNASDSVDWEQISAPYLNLFFLEKCGIIYICLFCYDIVVKKNRYAPIIINLSAASVCFLLAMSSVPVLASRISDMYGIVDCVLFTFLLYIISPRRVARLIIAAGGLFMLIYNMVNTEYFTLQ